MHGRPGERKAGEVVEVAIFFITPGEKFEQDASSFEARSQLGLYEIFETELQTFEQELMGMPGHESVECGRAFGIVGLALEWIKRFLVDRTQQILNLDRLNFGLPQGSVFGPLLVLLYTVELFENCRKKSWTAGGSSIRK